LALLSALVVTLLTAVVTCAADKEEPATVVSAVVTRVCGTVYGITFTVLVDGKLSVIVVGKENDPGKELLDAMMKQAGTLVGNFDVIDPKYCGSRI